MNRLLTVLLLLIALFGSAADLLNINCTTYPVWLLTREITNGVNNVRTELMIPAGTGCPHEYVLTPADMRRLGRKNLIVVRNGLGLDDFVLRPLQKMNPKAPVIDACAGLDYLESECSCGHDHGKHPHDHGHGKHSHDHAEEEHHHHHQKNPHLFASPDTASGMVGNIVNGLCKADPEHAAEYRKNAAAFDAKLRELVTETAKLKQVVGGKTVAVQHGIFDYLARLLDLKIVAEIQGEGIAPSASEMRKLVETIRQKKVAVIFTEPQYSAQTAKTLAKECGIGICRLDPLAGGPDDPPEDHYLTVMKENLNRIRGALTK